MAMKIAHYGHHIALGCSPSFGLFGLDKGHKRPPRSLRVTRRRRPEKRLVKSYGETMIILDLLRCDWSYRARRQAGGCDYGTAKAYLRRPINSHLTLRLGLKGHLH